jgi:cellulose synthase/poly-beta-1,6-N-acetylglucosamine synthase-like glycosyltransferase
VDILNIVLIGIFVVIYAWVLYNLPILVVGVRNLRFVRQRHSSEKSVDNASLPYYSVVVPAKSEEKTIGRLLNSLDRLEYPKDKIEVIVVEDGSKDNTLEICKQFAGSHSNVRILEKGFSNGKPSALNFGVEQCHGDIIAFFDADNVPAKDALLKAAGYFEDNKVAAVQGRTMSINSKENMLTQFISYEEAVWCEAYLRGKDSLGLFVHLKGSCQFIRRNILNQLSGFDENILSEDMEFSAKLAENNYSIRYGGDVCAWQESPSNLKALFKQRTRWFRGTMDVAVKYGKLLVNPSRRNFDAEATLFGPFILIASLLSYFMVFGTFLVEYPFNVVWTAFTYFSLASMTAIVLLCGFALIYVSKPRRISNLLWLPFVFAYWFIQGFIALYAGLLSLLRRPKPWLKTEKKGTITDPSFTIENSSMPEKPDKI